MKSPPFEVLAELLMQCGAGERHSETVNFPYDSIYEKRPFEKADVELSWLVEGDADEMIRNITK